MKRVLINTGKVVGAFAAIVVIYAAYLFIGSYRVEDNQSLEIYNTSSAVNASVPVGQELTITSYNVGFGAYSDDFTFFMDGGKEGVARSKEAVTTNLSGALEAVKSLAPDIALFQEVDKDGTRSHHTDQTQMAADYLGTDKAYSYVYAQNWDSPFLMYPFLSPHGANKSGIMSFSSFGINESIRRSLPVEGGVQKIIDLDRCYTKSRIPAEGGRELVLYNAHLSAYTSDPQIAANQLSMIINDMQEEYDKGNYCLAGGDLNSDLLDDSPAVFNSARLEANWASPIRHELFTDDITLVVPFDKNDPHPSARNADKPYEKGNFVVTVDGFIKSANISVVKSDVCETGFKYSDHNPVYLKFILNEEGYSKEAATAIDDFVKKYGKDSPGYNHDAYVVTDFDNTTSIFDITYQFVQYQLETMSFAMDPEALKAALSTELDMKNEEYGRWISDICTAYSHLYDKYGPFKAKGLDEDTQAEIQKDPYWSEFAAKMLAFYQFVEDTTSEAVGYSWILYWMSGMTPDEVYDSFAASCAKNEGVASQNVTWTSPETISSSIGSVSAGYIKGVSVPSDVKQMLKKLHDNGIDIWVCSASHVDGVRAAVDTFGLSEYVTGVIGMTQELKDGVYTNAYDYENGYAWANKGGGKWEKTGAPIKALSGLEGKVTAIENALVSMYKTGPLAGFMDSSGDFNFCTEFASLKMVICYNRANRKITDGGGLIAIAAAYQGDNLGYNLEKAVKNGDTYYLLQGRDENGTRALRPSRETIRLEENTPGLFANEDNMTLYKYLKDNRLTTKEFLDTFAISTDKTSAENKIGCTYGHLKAYRGYHSIK